MIVYFSVLGLMSIFCFSMVLLYWLTYFLTIDLLSFGGSYWFLNINFDNVTLLVLLMLLMCFIYVYIYTGHYFGVGEISGLELNKMMCIFVAVMASLVCTGDYLFTLMFWEYLGVVSFFLILFYNSYLSLRSSMVTLVSSRFGDVCLFLLMCLWSYKMNKLIPALMLFFFIILTKSASFPFTSWLLEAMRAPTPVSSLVHSSTLVAAGVWFAMRYDFLLFFNKSLIIGVFLIMTMFMTGLCCFFFLDLKKIVALSTCKNISWCIFYLIFGDCMLSLFQLISHGVSKCMLFMLVGDVMSGSSGSQKSNCVYNCYLYNNWGIFSLFSVMLGLSGTPFIGVFFSKHLLLTKFMNMENVMFHTMLLICVFLSYFYSFRLCSMLLNVKSSIVSGVLYFFNSSLMVYFWLFMNYFMVTSLEEYSNLNKSVSMVVMIFQLMACMTAYCIYSKNIFQKWSSSLFGCDKMVEYFYKNYNKLLKTVKLFFYRWDKYSMSLFTKLGQILLNWFSCFVLKMMLISLILIMMCYCMVY